MDLGGNRMVWYRLDSVSRDRDQWKALVNTVMNLCPSQQLSSVELINTYCFKKNKNSVV
jgi:hypothetical protein